MRFVLSHPKRKARLGWGSLTGRIRVFEEIPGIGWADWPSSVVPLGLLIGSRNPGLAPRAIIGSPSGRVSLMICPEEAGTP